MDPTLAGFQAFITSVMGIPPSALPLTAPVVAFSFNLAMNLVNTALTCMPNFDPTQPTIYATAVYNLAGDTLVNVAPDQPAPAEPYFAPLRASFGINSFTAGVITSTSDQATSEGMEVPDFVKGLTIANLQNLKTPWGRQYLAIAQSYGSLWGLT